MTKRLLLGAQGPVLVLGQGALSCRKGAVSYERGTPVRWSMGSHPARPVSCPTPDPQWVSGWEGRAGSGKGGVTVQSKGHVGFAQGACRFCRRIVIRGTRVDDVNREFSGVNSFILCWRAPDTVFACWESSYLFGSQPSWPPSLPFRERRV
ncbi:hypothetical protein T484DRAFT_1947211 [Baffinella frigidus]|nr:hypothetical protein T484DRAFT_1947211 [Cryptophyta sp. CCMP2293]